MTEPSQQYLTAAGAQRLRGELAQLKGPARAELARRLRSAIEMGDLSENADYHAAKEQQAFLEGRIQELEYVLRNAVIVEASDQTRDEVTIGVQVTVQEEDFEPETYHLVGVKEADPRQRRISNESPIGNALMGRRVGDEVVAQTPVGKVRLKILKIE
jgi:transcription elongation factor GreA